MASFYCTAMSTNDAARLRRATSDDFGYPIQRFDLDRTYPCRHCLREASAKAGMLLLSYQAPDCERFEQADAIPDIVRNRLVSFRAFRSDGIMIYDANAIVEGEGHEAAVRRIFAREDVAYINAHTARPGCLLCHIERA
jgi:hypothetical protein